VWAAALLAGGACGQQACQTKRGLVVTDQSFSPSAWTHGTVEHRFLVENPSAQRRTATITLPNKRYSSEDGGIDALAGSVVVEAGGRAVLSLVQPPMSISGDAQFTVAEPGAEAEAFSCRARDFQDYSHEETLSVLLSKRLSAEALSASVEAYDAEVEKAKAKRGRHAGSHKLEALRLEREPEAWPENWLAYAGFDGCVLDAADYARMPEGVRSALRTYAAAGGAVTFLGAEEPPAGWCEPGGAWRSTAWQLSEAAFGFGLVQVSVERPVALSGGQAGALVKAWASRKAPWPAGNSYSRHGGMMKYEFEHCLREIPISGGSRVPVNLFLATLLAFVLLAGPGAVIYCARTNRRIWLLAAVPAVSLAFSAAIFAAALLAEGVTPHLRRQAVTLLDQTRRQAATLGAVSVYAPTSLGGGLAFGRGTEVTPLSYGRNAEFKRIWWGRDQLFEDGWVRPRMAAFFRLRRSEERSERLVVTEREAGAVEIVNALGAPIRRLGLCDGRGGFFMAENVAPGEKRLLTSAAAAPGKAQAFAFDKLRACYGESSPGWGLDTALKAALPQPGPRTYVALLSGCPFLENPLAGRKAKELSESLVAGRY
jgi:hypothetical protein